jgi:hypothetical protein
MLRLSPRTGSAPESRVASRVSASAFLFLTILGINTLLPSPAPAQPVDGARYLVFCADSFAPIIEPLVEWKTKKGMPARVVRVPADVANSPDSIRTFVRNAWNNWPVRPEFVLLVGDPRRIRSYSNSDDNYFGDVTGNYLIEVPVGRLPVETARECSTLVNKCLAYERPAEEQDTAWYLRGTTVVGENSPDQWHRPDCRFARQLWVEAGFTLAESLDAASGHRSVDVTNAVNNGRSFLGYRGDGTGEWGRFGGINPNTWTNGYMMPVTVAGTCMTITLTPGEHMYGDRFIRAGTPQGLGGVISYFGTTETGHSRYRSECFKGFFNALFREGEFRLGRAALRGRAWIDSVYHSQSNYREWNLLGDPELNVFTGVPWRATVLYDSIVQMRVQTCTLTVLRNTSPVPGVLVCYRKDSTVYAWAETDSAGRAPIPLDPRELGLIDVTVTGKGMRPFEGTCRIVPLNMPWLVRAGMILDDYQGNGDGIVNPGEGIRVRLQLHNVGLEPAHRVGATLRLSDPFLTLPDSTSWYGTIRPGETLWADPFELLVDTTCPDSHVFIGNIEARDSAGTSWNLPFWARARAGRLELASVLVLDSPPGGNGNGRLGPNESGLLQVALRNRGGAALTRTLGLLAALDSSARMVDSTAWYGRVAAGETAAGRQDRFAVSCGPEHPLNQPLRLLLAIHADGGTYRFGDTVELLIPGEQGYPDEPTGPDRYGYFVYEDTDTASGRAPSYHWRELAPPGPGEYLPVVSDSDAAVLVVPLPFRYRFYGREFDSVSVGSNGFIVPGRSDFTSGRNGHVPDTSGPAGVIAPFWDDLNPDEEFNGFGTAYQFYDTAEHCWTVEYKDFAHYYLPYVRETFQVSLYDPAFRPTPTGDGEIRCQYHRVWLSTGCTIGIEDTDETYGLEYLCDDVKPSTTGPLQPERCLLFTTSRPLTERRPWLVLADIAVTDSLGGNGNGLFEPGEVLDIVLTVANQGTDSAVEVSAGVSSMDGDALVFDSVAALGTIRVSGRASNADRPFRLRVTELPADSLLDCRLVLTAHRYRTALVFTVGLSLATQTGVAGAPRPVRTGLEPVLPNPVTRRSTVRYSIARSASVDLALFDAVGRRVTTLVRAGQEPGWYSLLLPAETLGNAVYFLRLVATDRAGTTRVVRKLTVSR